MSGGEMRNSDNSRYPHLCFVITAKWMSRFCLLLQRGFTIRAKVGCSVERFLREEVGLSPDTIETIQSIFLDGSPVDDLASAMVRDGSTLALSAAMPGLVGATLRRGGAYSSFRSTITYRETGPRCIAGEGFVQMKLFNLMMDKVGPDLLNKGLFVRPSDLLDFLSVQPDDFWRECLQVLVDGRPLKTGSQGIIASVVPYERVFLSIDVRNGSTA
jgi:hypothetical protein